ncbi:hypothetical protein [Streptomyces spiralis]|uniref:hypothetical protein n=1 Tax=Streptomyces spiralis TaxID=66376 RepID=UPI0036A33CFC
MIPPTYPGPSAWSDESFQEKDSAGFYIIAAAIIEPDVIESAREAMAQLQAILPSAAFKAHWTEMGDPIKQQAIEAVAGLGGVHVVAVGSPVPNRRQERARSKCLAALAVQLHGFGVGTLYMEAREAELNKRDVKTIQHARRYLLPKGTQFNIEHLYGSTEPLLWVADIVAGACRAEQLGRGEYREALGDRVLDFEVPTDC